MKNGVPFDVAFSLYDHELLAWSVIYGEMEGGVFQWDSMSWKERNG